MNQEQGGSPRLVKNWLLLVGTWILAVGLFQVGCGGGGQAAGQVDESPESSMTSEVAGSDESAEASAESGSDEVASVDEEPAAGGSATSDEISAAGEEPGADTLLATEGMETESEAEADSDSASASSEEPEAEASSSVGSQGAKSEEGVASYTVEKGDCLWRIAEKPSIYQDPWEWPLLYHANEKIVSDPNLIHTGWNLDVPRGVEEAMIVAAVQEARAAKYVPPSRATRALSSEPAAVSNMEKPAANGKPAVVTTAKPGGEAKPMAAKKSGGLKGILWLIILAVLGAAGYLYWKKMNAGKSLGMGTASF